MKTLDLETERFSHTGGIDGDGASGLLGRPKIGPLPLLVRESVQNGWDARDSDSGPVYFDMHLVSLNPENVNTLRNSVFADVPPSHKRLRSWLSQTREHGVLWISDRGTVGLRGPTRADRVDENGHRNFCDLVRNLGRDKSLRVGGGTYGYGKSALFRASGCSTVVFYSRIRKGSGFESRLMIGSWTTRYNEQADSRTVPLTGRMWWGRLGDDGIVEPLVNDAADELAAAIGATTFAANTTGTTIGILSPCLNDTSPEVAADGVVSSNMSPEAAADCIVSSILWHCWPKMVDLGSGPQMHFIVRHNGEERKIPDPEKCSPLDAYVKALRLAVLEDEVMAPGSELACTIYRLRPKKKLGRLGLAVMPRREPNHALGKEHPVRTESHHVALMRRPKLVVTYLPGPQLPTDFFGYGAVFLAADCEDVERAFADAEPPSHDEWNPELLQNDNDRSCVRTAVRRIKENLEEFLAPPEGDGERTPAIGLGGFSTMMGALVSGIDGGGAGTGGSGSGGTGSGGGGSGGGSRRGSVVVRPFRLAREGRKTVAFVPFDVHVPPGNKYMRVRGHVAVGILDGGAAETEPPAGAPVPKIISWSDPHGREQEETGLNELEIPAACTGTWTMKVVIPDDVQVIADVKVI